LQHPSWVEGGIAWQPFSVDQMDKKRFPLRRRWETEAPFTKARDAFLAVYDQQSNRTLEPLIEHAPRTEDGYVDLRGFDFGMTGAFVGKAHLKPRYRELNVDRVDFSEALFENCNFQEASLTDCKFQAADFYDFFSKDTKFSRCYFSKSVHEDSGLGVPCVYDQCNFDNVRTKGSGFSVGFQNKYVNCSMRDVRIFVKGYGVPERLSTTTFDRCRISGLVRNFQILGRDETRRFRLGARWWNWFSKRYDGARFANCDLSGLHLEDVEVFSGVIFENCKMCSLPFEKRDQSIYFPPLTRKPQ
jgi:uncharacterized protein YjbI with pentapeptide repeats